MAKLVQANDQFHKMKRQVTPTEHLSIEDKTNQMYLNITAQKKPLVPHIQGKSLTGSNSLLGEALHP